MRRSDADAKHIRPLARIVAHATHSHEPEWFTTAPVGAMKKVLEKAGWQTADVDLYEVNEAFATVTMAAMKELDLPHDKVNVNGGESLVDRSEEHTSELQSRGHLVCRL